jgi:hypothetical protein
MIPSDGGTTYRTRRAAPQHRQFTNQEPPTRGNTHKETEFRIQWQQQAPLYRRTGESQSKKMCDFQFCPRKNAFAPRFKTQSAKILPKKPRNSRENENSPFQKPRKRAFTSRNTGGKNSRIERKYRKNCVLRSPKTTNAAEIVWRMFPPACEVGKIPRNLFSILKRMGPEPDYTAISPKAGQRKLKIDHPLQ